MVTMYTIMVMGIRTYQLSDTCCYVYIHTYILLINK